METDRTGSFEYDSMTNEERKSIIIEKIEDDLENVKNQLDSPISEKERFKLIGMQSALEELKGQINAIQENTVRLVSPNSRLLATPQHLNTDNKFLNEAYFKAMVIRDKRPRFGTPASSREGVIGKKEVMSEIMNDIKALV